MGKVAINNFNARKVQTDVANWVSREPYGILASIEKKINGRLQRKFKLKINPQILEEKIKNYREIYNVTKQNLPKYTLRSESGYAEPENIKSREIKEFLRKKFPEQDEKILDVIMNWVVEYEYLR